jgi:hypothetical protein
VHCTALDLDSGDRRFNSWTIFAAGSCCPQRDREEVRTEACFSRGTPAMLRAVAVLQSEERQLGAVGEL